MCAKMRLRRGSWYGIFPVGILDALLSDRRAEAKLYGDYAIILETGEKDLIHDESI
jgi:hypothetical protein